MGTDIAALLAEGEWLKRLARSLCGDAAEADDVVQEVYAAALRSPPDPDRPHRPWLRRVAHNVLRMRHRTRSRRVANETASEQLAEPAARPDDVVERAQLERRLTELVLELDEPFRTTVLLRYREGLTAEAIAKREGIPAGTVRRRLKTATDRLRGKLDEHDGRWRAAFAPLVALKPHNSLWRMVMAKTSTKVVLAIAIILLALLASGLVRRARGTRHDEAAGRRASVAARDEHAGGAVPSTIAFVQPGVAMRTLEGIVRYDGKPFAGAQVHLADAETRTALGDATSGPDGRFTFGARAAAAYDVSATAPGKLGRQRVDLRAPATPVELLLIGCSKLEGFVLDGSGVPIAHARVVNQAAPTPFAETDAQGHYELCARVGPGRFEYTAGGYGGVTEQVEMHARLTHDVTLVPEAIVAGTVVTADGSPVPDAWVTVDPFDKGFTRRAVVRAHTDSAGTFRIAGIAAGRNQVSAVAAGLASRRIEVVAGVGQVIEGLVVRVERGARITGIVKLGDTPIAGAGIGMRVGGHLEGTTAVNASTFAVTQADGSFTIDRVPYGDIGLFVDGYTVVTPRDVHVATPNVEVTIKVDLLGTIRGHVTRQGAVVRNAIVSCPGSAEPTKDDGSYICTSAAPGSHELYTYDSEGHWGWADAIAIRGETVTADIELAMDSEACGHVVDADGKPMRGIEVHLVDPNNGDQGSDVSNTDGAFCVQYLMPGDHQVSVNSNGQQLSLLAPTALVKLGAGRTELTIVTQRPVLSIVGAITDGSGAPVADAVVRAQPNNKTGERTFQQDVAMTISDPNGRFELSHLAAGNYAVLATGRDGSERVVEPVAAGTRGVAITLEKAGQIDGKLVGFTSPPVITGIIMSGQHEPFDGEVDGSHFRASGLSPGTYTLMAIASNHEGDTQKVVVTAGQTTPVTMTSRGSATLAVRLLDFKKRTPIAGARCRGLTRQGPDIGVVYNTPDDAVVTDARGETVMDSPAGEIVVACTGPRIVEALTTTKAPVGQMTHVDVLAVPAGDVNGTIDARIDFLGRRVAEITRGGQADQAGLAVGDEIVTVDGLSIAELFGRSLIGLITRRPGGTTAMLGILRGGTAKTISVIVRIDR